MARRRNNLLNTETLSQETPEVQEQLLNELVEDKKEEIIEEPVNNQENEDKNVDTSVNEIDNLSNEENTSNEIKPGDRVKINKDVQFDIQGAKIHNGLKNYTYTVRNVRPDKMVIIECLTRRFTVKQNEITKI